MRVVEPISNHQPGWPDSPRIKGCPHTKCHRLLDNTLAQVTANQAMPQGVALVLGAAPRDTPGQSDQRKRIPSRVHARASAESRRLPNHNCNRCSSRGGPCLGTTTSCSMCCNCVGKRCHTRRSAGIFGRTASARNHKRCAMRRTSRTSSASDGHEAASHISAQSRQPYRTHRGSEHSDTHVH